jgi:hypothetical protein
MDLVTVSEAVALMTATGAIQGLGEKAALDVVARFRERIRDAFHGDSRSTDALESAIHDSADEHRIRELASALTWHAGRNGQFADELAKWAGQYQTTGSVTQNVRAGRDAYTAGGDMTVNQTPTER